MVNAIEMPLLAFAVLCWWLVVHLNLSMLPDCTFLVSIPRTTAVEFIQLSAVFLM